MDQPFTDRSGKDVVPFYKGLSIELNLSPSEAVKQLDLAITPFMEQSSKLATMTLEGVRSLEGWVHQNIISGPSSDISTIIETADGGVLHIILTQDKVPKELSEDQIVDYVRQHSDTGIIEYYAPDAIAEAKQANPGVDMQSLLYHCKPSIFDQIGPGFDKFIFGGNPTAYLMERAQFTYADQQIEAFTHLNEVHGGINTDDAFVYARRVLELYGDAVEKMKRGDFTLLDDFIPRDEIEAILGKLRLVELAADIKSAKQKLEDETLQPDYRIAQATAHFIDYFKIISQIRLKLEIYILRDKKTYKNVWNEGVVQVLNNLTSTDKFGERIGLEGTYGSPGMATDLEIALSRAALQEYFIRQPQIILPLADKPQIDK